MCCNFLSLSPFGVPVCHCVSISNQYSRGQWKPWVDLSLWCSASSRWCKWNLSEYKYSLKMKLSNTVNQEFSGSLIGEGLSILKFLLSSWFGVAEGAEYAVARDVCSNNYALVNPFCSSLCQTVLQKPLIPFISCSNTFPLLYASCWFSSVVICVSFGWCVTEFGEMKSQLISQQIL